MLTGTTDTTTGGSPTQEMEVESLGRLVRCLSAGLTSHCSRPVAGAPEPTGSVSEPRGDDAAGSPRYAQRLSGGHVLTCSPHCSPPTTFQEDFAAFRKTVENGFAGLAFPKFTTRFVETKRLFCLRLETAIKESNSTPTDIDPTTNFWTAYKTVADEHDDAMLKKYGEDLDTSLLFVSTFTHSSHVFCPLNPFFSYVRRVCSLPSPQLSLPKSFHSQTPPAP